MTERQQAVLSAIETHIEKNGFSPSLKELMQSLGISSTSTIHEHLKRLRRKGMITWVEGAQRTIRVLSPTESRP